MTALTDLVSTDNLPKTLIVINANNVKIVDKLAEYSGNGDFYSTGGTFNAIVLTAQASIQAPSSLLSGLSARFISGGNNTTAVTVNVAGLGIKDLRKNDGSVLIADDIIADRMIEISYDSVNGYFVINTGLSISPDVLTNKGDLLVFNTGYDRLPIGTDGQYLISDSSQSSGLSWKTSSKPLNVPYSVNSGLTSINKVSGTEVSFTLASGGMVVTFPNGKTYTLTTVNNVTGITTNQNTVFIIEEANISGGVVTPKAVLASKVNETLLDGTGGADGDYNLNIAVRPLTPEKRISSVWTATQFVKLGEVTGIGGVLGTPIVYAFNGLYKSAYTAIAASTTYSINHNIGYIPKNTHTTIKCITIDKNYAVGDEIDLATLAFATSMFSPYKNKNTGGYRHETGLIIQDKTISNGTSITFANWTMAYIAERGF